MPDRLPDRLPVGPAAPDLRGPTRRVHLVGVGGTGMRSLAELLADLGHQVSGCDRSESETLARLAGRGIRVQPGHDAAHLEAAELAIVSAAIPADNPELAAAHAGRLPVLTHAEALGALMATRRGIAVAGTHGKSTTTALVAHLLAVADRDPTLVGGADALDFGGSARLGQGPELVAEADEYARRFLALRPALAVITGVEPDHLDYYGSFDAIREAFRQFVAAMPPDGAVVTCEDEPNLAGLALGRRRVRYGWAGHADWRLERFEPRPGGGGQFTVRRPDGRRAAYELRLTGRHNAANAVAALAVAAELGVPDEAARRALATFRGTVRRFQTLVHPSDNPAGVWIVDDYAHHPTAVAATLTAAREVHRGPLLAVFQPHTSHRTRALLAEFAGAFSAADRLLLLPTYQPAGREDGAATETSAELAARMTRPDVRLVPTLDAAFAALLGELRPGTLVLVMGAGDVTELAHRLARRVQGAAPAGVAEREMAESEGVGLRLPEAPADAPTGAPR